MGTNHTAWKMIVNHLRAPKTAIRARSKGQAVVEFTLVFILLLVVAWIPADFGLAFYTGQLALNASRDGARIAAADRNPVSDSCTMPCTGKTGILRATADRMSSALLPGATITLSVDGGTDCNRQVRVRIDGTYNFFFYQLLRLFGVSSAGNPHNITRQTNMRWEHQC